MKRILELLLHLYPQRWRDRYETEFQALLEDMRPRWVDLADILKEALRLRFATGSALGLSCVCALLGALLLLTVSLFIPGKFVSSGVLKAPARNSQLESDEIGHAAQQILSRHSLTQIIDHYGLYEHRRTVAPLEDVIYEMRKDIRIGNVLGQAHAFQVWFAYPDAAKAQAITRELMEQFAQQPGFALVNRPNLPTKTEAPNRLLFAFAGLSTGAIAGLILYRLLRRRRSIAS